MVLLYLIIWINAITYSKAFRVFWSKILFMFFLDRYNLITILVKWLTLDFSTCTLLIPTLLYWRGYLTSLSRLLEIVQRITIDISLFLKRILKIYLFLNNLSVSWALLIYSCLYWSNGRNGFTDILLNSTIWNRLLL